MALLDVKDLKVSYGPIHAIKGISFYVEKGEIVSLIGANGAGKTTTLHAISGLLKPEKPKKSGKSEKTDQPENASSIIFDEHNLVATPAHKIVNLGLAQVPEGRRIFAGMTVKENLQMGAFIRTNSQDIKQDYDKVLTMLPRLKERRKQIAGTLSGGEQQMLAIGRALMSSPSMLLLDEPSMGLSPLLVQEIFSIIADVNNAGVTVLLVEQNAKMALQISRRAYVLETGRVVMQGAAADLAKNEEVKKAYLGG